MKEIEIKNVIKEYKLGNKETFKALSDVNVSFKKGELVSIVGESGSGKSTLMNLIGGLDSDFSGDIIVSGTNLKGLKDKELDKYRKNKVGFVFQSFNLIPHLSILDNVTIALTLSGIKEHEKIERATNILKKVGLEAHLKKKPNQLSGGQKQRVAIARALINNPDVILADEPTGALDSQTSLQILEILKEIADEGKLVIMVTHSEKVAAISSRVIELIDGKIVRDEKNKNYKKVRKSSKKEKVEINNEKQTLSFWSAIKLAFHNMWASKTKNILMAIGVSISIASLILMLSFASGLTGYISNLAKEYSSPTIVTISKENPDDTLSSFAGLPFTEEEILQLKDELNQNPLKNSNFKVTDENISYGFMALTGFTQSATVEYSNEGTPVISPIFAAYTTPSYYTDSNLIEGTLSKENEIMFSAALIEKYGKDILGKEVKITLDYNGTIISKNAKVTAIVDVSMFSSMLVMYVDYDFLNQLVFEASLEQEGTGSYLQPTSIYIETDSQDTTNLINNYIRETEKYTGSIEERLANMFTQMLETFGLALTIIAAITSESFLIGILSGLLGCILSILLIVLITIVLNSAIGIAPITLRWEYLLISMGVSIFISMLAGLYPSAKAAKLDPVEALRRE